VVDQATHLLTADLVVHEPSGLYELTHPMETTIADQVSGEQMRRLIEHLKTFAGHVIMDLHDFFHDLLVSVF